MNQQRVSSRLQKVYPHAYATIMSKSGILLHLVKVGNFAATSTIIILRNFHLFVG